MKKILFIITQSEFGGAQRYIYEMGRLFDRDKYKISVAAGPGDGELFRKMDELSIPHRKLEELKRAPNPLQILAAIREMRHIIKDENPDVVFLCSTTAGILGALATIFLKTKVVYRIGGWAFRDPRPFWMNWVIIWAERATSKLKDAIIVNSEFDWRIAVKKRIVSPQRIFKVYNGLDTSTVSFLSKEESKKELALGNGPLIVTVANFYKTKGLEGLINAAKKVSKTNPEAKFVVIGDGRLRDRLEGLIRHHGLEDKVFLKGRIPNAYKYLKAFDLFVLPSLKEGFPWILLEAMAAGLPVIATQVGAVPEIIEDGKEGITVKPGDVESLAEKIAWALDNQKQTDEMKGKATDKLNTEFTSERMAKETEKVISGL